MLDHDGILSFESESYFTETEPDGMQCIDIQPAVK